MASATVKLEKNRRPGSFLLDEAGIALLGVENGWRQLVKP
jgi:hypothetical protein